MVVCLDFVGLFFAFLPGLCCGQGMTMEQLRDKTHDTIFDLLKLSPEFNPLLEQPLKKSPSSREHGL